MTITQQIGAMALIDELRANDIALEEHLNADQQKSALFERIRDYYKKKGIAVNDELINMGVQEYFKNRLRFIPTTLTPLERALATLFITRNRWLKKTVATCLSLIVLTVVTVNAKSWLEAASAERRMVQEQTYEKDLNSLKERVNQTAKEVFALSLWTPKFTSSAYLGWMSNVKDSLSEATSSVYTLPNQLDADERDISSLEAAAENVDSVQSLVKAKSHWVSLEEQMGQLAARSETEKWYPPVAKAWSDLRAQASDGGADIVALHQSLIALNRLLRVQSTVDSKQKALEEKFRAAIASGIAGKDRNRVEEVYEMARRNLGDFNMDDFQSKASELAYLSEIATTELQYRVVNRPGTKSGVERTYNSSGGKKWYGVVEAINGSGHPFAMRVTDSESSRVSNATIFAVEITQSRYQEMKEDKLSDEIVDDAILGTKPIGKLEFTRNTGVLAGLITIW